MGFTWPIPPKKRAGKQTNWDKKFEDLLEYKEKHGNLNVPLTGYEKSPQLGAWVKRQRKYKREGNMKDEKFDRLKAIGFNFGGPKQVKKSWESQYESLVGKLTSIPFSLIRSLAINARV